MSDYIIKFTAPSTAPNYKPPFTVVDGTLNITSTSLALCGHNYPNYGSILWTNVVHMLENFCSNSYPEHSTMGQTWYDSANEKLMVNNGTDYVYISGNDTLTLTWPNLEALMKTQSPPYYDGRYVSRNGDTGVGSIAFANNQNLTLLGDGTVKTSYEATADEDVVNRKYIAKLFSYLGYDINNFGTSTAATIYLELTGGTMKANANISFAGSGTVKVNDDPVVGVDVVNLSYANDHYVSFEPGLNIHPVANLKMSGPLTLYPDSCDLADDSLEAVPAQWVTDKIKAALAGFGGGTGAYIPITSAIGTAVNNNLTFDANKWIKVDLDAGTWATDDTFVLNKKQANLLYVSKTGDSLTDHPFAFTQPTTQPTAAEEKLDALNVPTAGWVNHRIKDAVAAGGGGAGGSTATKLSTYGASFAVPVTQTTAPTSPNQTITLNIPSTVTAIDYEIRFGSILSTTGTASTGLSSPKVRYLVKANGTQVYQVSYGGIGGDTIKANQPCDDLHTFKYSSPANTTSTLTVEFYGYCYTLQGGFPNGYDVKQWIIADPLSATVAIQATNAPPAGSVTAGPAGNVTYVDFGNGMVMISGMTPLRKSPNTTLPAFVFYGADITFPNNIKLQIPYTVTATVLAEPGSSKASLDQTWSDGLRVNNILQTGCSIDWLVLTATGATAVQKAYYASGPTVHWTVTGFKV